MNVRLFLFMTVMIVGFVGNAYAAPISSVSAPAGVFGPPISESQTGPNL